MSLSLSHLHASTHARKHTDTRYARTHARTHARYIYNKIIRIHFPMDAFCPARDNIEYNTVIPEISVHRNHNQTK